MESEKHNEIDRHESWGKFDAAKFDEAKALDLFGIGIFFLSNKIDREHDILLRVIDYSSDSV